MKISIATSFVAFLSFSSLVCSAAPVATTSQPAQLTILRPNGKPAAGALVVVLPLQHPENTYIFRGDFNPASELGIEQYRSDAQGSLALANLRKDQWIAIFDPSGYLEADRDAIGHGTLTLLPWCRVEGKLIRQGGDIARQTMRGYCSHSKGKGRIMFFQETRTDADGHFVLDCFPAGKVGICRMSTQAGGMQNTVAELLSGKTTVVTVGGVGRVVTGKIEIPAALIGDKKWKCYGSILSVQNYPPSPKPEEILDSIDEKKRDAWMQAFLKTDAGKAYQAEEDKVRSSLHGFTMEFESDGSFRIEDVLPGDYDLTASLFLLSAVPDPDTQGDQIGECHAKISVPAEKNSDHGPSQVPAITMLEARTSRVGKPIQPFSAPTLDGKKLNLSDFKGHYVLLDFWATCCGPCVAEVPNLKAVYDVYGKDGRLKIISLSLDENPANAKRFVEKNQIAWNQVWVGDDAGRQVLDTIEPNNGIPYILLIDPDGKVMATNLRGPGIKSAVAKAMSQK